MRAGQLGARARHVAADEVVHGDRFVLHAKTNRAVGFVGGAFVEEFLNAALINFSPLALQIRTEITADFRAFVPENAEPAEAVEYGLQRLGAVAFGVGVVDAQDELPAHLPREEPIEERGADAADVQITRGARCEARAYGHGFTSRLRCDARQELTTETQRHRELL